MTNSNQLTDADKVAPSVADLIAEQYADAFAKAEGHPLEKDSPEVREVIAQVGAVHEAAHNVMAARNGEMDRPNNMSSRIISDSECGSGWFVLMTNNDDKDERHILELSDDLSTGEVFYTNRLLYRYSKK